MVGTVRVASSYHRERELWMTLTVSGVEAVAKQISSLRRFDDGKRVYPSKALKNRI